MVTLNFSWTTDVGAGRMIVMQVNRLFLFDVDLTLIQTGGAGLRSLDRTFKRYFGLEHITSGYRPDGKTDLVIIRELLVINRLRSRVHSSLVRRLADLYLECLSEEMVLGLENASVMPGVEKLVRTIAETPGCFNGLLTGNLEKGAAIKLAPFGLRKYFPVGAFGSDNEDRSKLVDIALARAARYYGTEFQRKYTYVIGDSVHDIRCGKSNGCVSVAVNTGSTPYEELEREGPDLIFRDFREPEKVLERMLQIRPCPE